MTCPWHFWVMPVHLLGWAPSGLRLPWGGGCLHAPSCTMMPPALAWPAGPVCVCGHSCVCSARVRLPGTDSSCSGAAGDGYEATGAGGVAVAGGGGGLASCWAPRSSQWQPVPPLALRGHVNHGDTHRPLGGACYLSDFWVSVCWSQITATQVGSSLGVSVLDGLVSTREAEIAPSQYSMLCARGVPGLAPPHRSWLSSAVDLLPESWEGPQWSQWKKDLCKEGASTTWKRPAQEQQP